MINPRRKPGEVTDNYYSPRRGDIIKAPLRGAVNGCISPQADAWGYSLKCLSKA